MVAYNFQRDFEQPIRERVKRSTIRPRGKRRHARIGGAVQLYVGMRTKACRRVLESPCVDRQEVTVRRMANGRLALKLGGIALAGAQLDRFVEREGFSSHEALMAWFEQRHGLPFSGEYIEWR